MLQFMLHSTVVADSDGSAASVLACVLVAVLGFLFYMNTAKSDISEAPYASLVGRECGRT